MPALAVTGPEREPVRAWAIVAMMFLFMLFNSIALELPDVLLQTRDPLP
jgi:hypothetical protein